MTQEFRTSSGLRLLSDRKDSGQDQWLPPSAENSRANDWKRPLQISKERGDHEVKRRCQIGVLTRDPFNDQVDRNAPSLTEAARHANNMQVAPYSSPVEIGPERATAEMRPGQAFAGFEGHSRAKDYLLPLQFTTVPASRI